MKNINYINTVKTLFNYIVTFGRPSTIIQDHASHFNDQMIKEFNRILGINLNFTTQQNLQVTDTTEQINLSIANTIKTLMNKGVDFYTATKLYQVSYNESNYKTTGFVPKMNQFGRRLSHIFDDFHPNLLDNRLVVHDDYFVLTQDL